LKFALRSGVDRFRQRFRRAKLQKFGVMFHGGVDEFGRYERAPPPCRSSPGGEIESTDAKAAERRLNYFEGISVKIRGWLPR
jgi:hypothetical protein